MKTPVWIVLAFLIAALYTSTPAAESKAEAELRVRLATLETQLASASAEKAKLAAALNKIADKPPVTVAGIAETNNANAAIADANATKAQLTAEENGRIATEAARAAKEAAETLKTQLEEVKDAADRGNIRLIITLGFGFLTVMMPLLIAYFREARTHSWAVEDAMRKDAAATANHADVVVKLGEVKAEAREAKVAAGQAFVEANTVNQKLETIGVQMRDGNPLEEKKG